MNTKSLVAETTNVGALERITSAAVGALLIGRLARQQSFGTFLGAALGADLVYRGVSGQCAIYRATGINTAEAHITGSQVDESSPRIQRSLTIAGSPDDLYTLWHQPETLRAIMAHFAHVEESGEGTTLWQVKGPLQSELRWNSRYTVEEPGRELGWESLPGTQLPNQGKVTFRPAPHGLGTEVTVSVQFQPPLGPLGSSVAKMLKRLPEAISGASLRRFKALAETGEIPTLQNNPSGRGTGDSV